LGYEVGDIIAQDVYDRYLTECTGYHTMNERIDRLQELMQIAELKQLEIAKLWKAEYGL
jgi:hypothetical protein